jgi:monoamine oxidase
MDIIIIGAGLAGLSCAHILQRDSPHLRILIVEARSVIGGRVFPTYFAGHPVELGAELVHGTNTVLNRLLDEIKCPTEPVFTWAHGDGGPHPSTKVRGGGGYYYIGAESLLLSHDSTEPDFVHLNMVLHDMTVSDSNQSNQSVLDYLQANRVSPRMIQLAQAGYANTLCSSLSMLPQTQTVQVMDKFDGDGNSELISTQGYGPLLQHLAKGLNIKTNWAVKHIHWKKNKVVLYSETGEELVAKRIVCAVPVSIMKTLEFHPRLPESRIRIYHSIRMEPCMKIALRFTRQIYPDDFHGMICSDCVIPEFWRSHSSDCILMAFASSTYATHLASLSTSKLQTAILNQLDRIFVTATDSFIDMKVQDWTKEKYIQGGYSSPSFHVSEEDRNEIASPIDSTLFFAGEHCGARYMVMHSAMESGILAAIEVRFVPRTM